MHFLHILPYSWENGGPSKVVHDIATFQVNNGDKVSIITIEQKGHKRYKEIDGVELIAVEEHFFSRYLPFFSTQLWSILKDINQRFDVIHLHCLWNYTLLAAHLLSLQAKCIVTIHGTLHPFTFKGSRIKRGIFSFAFQRKFLEKVKMIHVLHEGEKHEIQRYLSSEIKNVRIIPNGIDVPELFKYNSGKNNKVLFLSRLHYKKGLHLLLPAFKLVVDQVPHAKLIIAGPDFGMLNFVQKFIASHSLSANISYIGSVDGQDKIDLLVSSKIFVLPSYSEGFSISVLEALAYQIPVVVSSETGISDEIEQSKSGIIVDLDINSISRAILELLNDSEKSKNMGSNGRNLVIEKFETNKVCSLFDLEVKKCFA